MYSRRTPTSRVDVVDLDPYGSASPFIDSAIGSIADGGLLCVTCTDLAVLAGAQYPEKAYVFPFTPTSLSKRVIFLHTTAFDKPLPHGLALGMC